MSELIDTPFRLQVLGPVCVTARLANVAASEIMPPSLLTRHGSPDVRIRIVQPLPIVLETGNGYELLNSVSAGRLCVQGMDLIHENNLILISVIRQDEIDPEEEAVLRFSAGELAWGLLGDGVGSWREPIKRLNDDAHLDGILSSLVFGATGRGTLTTEKSKLVYVDESTIRKAFPKKETKEKKKTFCNSHEKVASEVCHGSSVSGSGEPKKPAPYNVASESQSAQDRDKNGSSVSTIKSPKEQSLEGDSSANLDKFRADLSDDSDRVEGTTNQWQFAASQWDRSEARIERGLPNLEAVVRLLGDVCSAGGDKPVAELIINYLQEYQFEGQMKSLIAKVETYLPGRGGKDE